MPKALLRNIEYKVKGVNYNRTMSYKQKGYYEKGLLLIEPHQDIRITIISFPYEGDVEIFVEKYNNSGKQISNTSGIVPKTDLIEILGFDT